MSAFPAHAGDSIITGRNGEDIPTAPIEAGFDRAASWHRVGVGRRSTSQLSEPQKRWMRVQASSSAVFDVA